MGLDLLKNNFSSGEIAPILQTRTDVVLYQNGAKRLENVIPQVEGGVKKRNGTKLISQGGVNDFVRLIAFIPSTKNPFLLMMGVNTISVIDASTMTVVATVTTTYSSKEIIHDLQFVYSEYTMYFAHPDYAPRTLKVSKDLTTWSFSTINFDVPPLASNPDSPNSAIKPSGMDVGELITIQATVYVDWNNDTQYFTGDRVTYSSQTWEAKRDNIGVTPVAGDDWMVFTGTSIGPFTTNDIGSIISVNGGLVRVTQFINTFNIRGTVLKKLSSEIVARALSWTIQEGAFSSETGYPRCVLFYKQRLVFANTKGQPNTIWLSRTGFPRNFLETTEDADAFSVAPATEKADAINYLVQTSGGIAVLTGGSEFFVRSSSGALTPTGVEINDNTFWGSFSDFKPARVGNEVLFNQRGGMRIRALSYRYEVDGLVSPDISVTAAHIPADHGAFIDAAYQQEPNNTVWMILEDGTAATLTLNREQELISWARQKFNGDIKSIESIPTYVGYDRVFGLFQRESTMYLEEITEDSQLDSMVSVVGGSGNTLAVGTNLSWATSPDQISAYYVEDSKYMMVKVAEFDSVSGTVTLIDDDYSGKTIHLGRSIDCLVDLLPPDVSQAPQSGRDYKVSVQRVTATIYKTLGLIVNGKGISTSKFSDNPLTAKTPVSRDIVIGEHGWRDMVDFKLTIEHNYPAPFHLQAITMKVEMNQK